MDLLGHLLERKELQKLHEHINGTKNANNLDTPFTHAMCQNHTTAHSMSEVVKTLQNASVTMLSFLRHANARGMT